MKESRRFDIARVENSLDVDLGSHEGGECIVTSALKVDFHIHSAASAHKDGKKVKGNASKTSET